MKSTQIAREAINSYFKKQEFYPGEETEKKYSEEKASFITLTKNKQLRGCIGSLEATKPLWKDIIENAINAAFHDPRFEPLKEKELDDIKIEVSILSEPKPLKMKNHKFIQKKINREMGLILKYKGHTATFLPQVWEEIHDKIEFLEQLAQKAGLNKNDWQHADLFYYTVEKFKE
jgi:AmmeMemoRadiSam system protein A